jgi:hypothetical protein
MSQDLSSLAHLNNVSNLTPHAIRVYDHTTDEDEKLAVEFPSAWCLRAASSKQRDLMHMRAHNTSLLVMSAPSHTGYTAEMMKKLQEENAMKRHILVSMVDGHLLCSLIAKGELHFDGLILGPDTGPESVVRNDDGDIVGVKRLVMYHDGRKRKNE